MIKTTYDQDGRDHRISRLAVLAVCCPAALVACGGAPDAHPAAPAPPLMPLRAVASAAPSQPANPAKPAYPDRSKAGVVDERAYTEGPVTDVTYLRIEYGRFEEYIDWLNSTWKPTMEAMKKAGLIIDYKVFSATPKSADQPNMIKMITYENMAALDKGIEQEAVAKEVIGSTEVQNKARVFRNEYRKVLGGELIRELILK